MPKQTSKLETRLSEADRQRFERLYVSRLGSQRDYKRTELVREAIQFYLAHQEEQSEDERNAERDKLIVEALKRMENRFASLLVRLGIDVETMYGYLWTTADRNERTKQFEQARIVGVNRFRKKLEAVDLELKEKLSKQPNKLSK